LKFPLTGFALLSLGEALPAQALSRYNVTYEDSKRRPFAVFEFRYRSLGEYSIFQHIFQQRAICGLLTSHLNKEGLYREGIVSRPEDTADPPHGPEADATPIREVDVFALPEAEAREMLQRLLESRRVSLSFRTICRNMVIDIEQNEPHIKPENPTGGNNVSFLSP
jgi:hypothetical protein